MRTLVLRLEYGCFPLWIYNDNGELISNDMVPEIQDYVEIENELMNIQSEYDKHFINNEVEFKYNKMDEGQDKVCYLKKVEELFTKLKEILQDKYFLKNCINEEVI